MSDDKFEQSEPKDENEDVEAHSPVRATPVRATPVRAANEEPGSDDEVEAHNLRDQPRRA